MAEKYWKFKVIWRTKTHIAIDISPALKGLKEIPSHIIIKNPKDIKVIY